MVSNRSQTDTTRKPQNSERTRALSDHAWGVLAAMSAKPLLRHLINPGVRNRLFREGLCEDKFDGRFLELRITDAGRARLREKMQ